MGEIRPSVRLSATKDVEQSIRPSPVLSNSLSLCSARVQKLFFFYSGKLKTWTYFRRYETHEIKKKQKIQNAVNVAVFDFIANMSKSVIYLIRNVLQLIFLTDCIHPSGFETFVSNDSEWPGQLFGIQVQFPRGCIQSF